MAIVCYPPRKHGERQGKRVPCRPKAAKQDTGSRGVSSDSEAMSPCVGRCKQLNGFRDKRLTVV